MSYIKLCQISNEVYIEDCDANIILESNIQYPLQLNVEVIDWQSEDEFKKHGKINAFYKEIVNLDVQPGNIREAVYQQLLIKYPNLVK